MLVVSRKVGQSIHIGDDIIIYFIEKTGTLSMRIGIEAPKDVKILRSELIETNKQLIDWLIFVFLFFPFLLCFLSNLFYEFLICRKLLCNNNLN